MPDFKFTGSETMVFPSLPAADGSTLVCNPGDTVTLDVDPGVDSLQPVATKSAKAADPTPAPDASQTPPEAPTSPATPAA
jgi:hypothetical protein